MIVIIGCNKGGASKTTTAINISVDLAKRGNEVCLVDADVQRTAAKWHAEREASGILPSITLIEKQGNIASTLRTLASKFKYVIVDVAGRNSRELISGATVANIIIAPHQCSQFDLDTIEELQQQIVRISDVNPSLKVYGYQAIASTNSKVRPVERKEFEGYLAEFPEIELLNSVSSYRKAYRDSASLGKSVIETDNLDAANEVRALVDEVFYG